MSRILIVDDEPDFTFTVKKILEREGFEVSEANSGREALEVARIEKPDLILLDIMMPDMDGWDVSRKLKEDKDLKSVPVIMLTVKFQRDAKLKSFHYAGCDGYISKPITKDKLLKAIHWVLGEPYADNRKVPSKCGIDCSICDQFIYEVCRGCLSDREGSCTVSECTLKEDVNSCIECVKIDYCKKRKEAIAGCLVFNPTKWTKKNVVYLISEEEKDEGYKTFQREVFEGSPGLVFTSSGGMWKDTEIVEVNKPVDMGEIRNRIHSFVDKKQDSVILIESIDENAMERPFLEVLSFVEDLHNVALENNSTIIFFVNMLEKEKRHQIFNYLASLQTGAIVKAVSNVHRKDILEILKMAGKSNFSGILQSMGYTTPSKLSFHLKILKQVGIIDQDSNGIYYLTDTGRKLDELIYKMRETVLPLLSVTPDFEVDSVADTVTESGMETYNRYVKSAEKAGLSKTTEILKDLDESLSVFFGEEQAKRIIITVLDEYISSEKMLVGDEIKRVISEISFVFLSDIMPLEDAIDWAEKLLVKHSLKTS